MSSKTKRSHKRNGCRHQLKLQPFSSWLIGIPQLGFLKPFFDVHDSHSPPAVMVAGSLFVDQNRCFISVSLFTAFSLCPINQTLVNKQKCYVG